MQHSVINYLYHNIDALLISAARGTKPDKNDFVRDKYYKGQIMIVSRHWRRLDYHQIFFLRLLFPSSLVFYSYNKMQSFMFPGNDD